jgi:hypothetical protein
MEPSPPALPRTIIVVDDYPNEVSAFLCGVLDAHALPYVVQVVDARTPLFDHRAPLEARRAPTVIWLDRLRRPRAGQGRGQRLKGLGRTVLPLHRLRYGLQRRLQGHRSLAWWASLGLVVSLGVGAPWGWQAERRPGVPSRPVPHSAPPAASPVVEVLLPTQSLAPAAPVPLTRTAPAESAAGEPRPRPPTAAARPVTSRRPPAPAPPHASTRPRAVVRAPLGGVHRPQEQMAPLPAPQPPGGLDTSDPTTEGARPWNRRIVNETGV